MSPKYREGAIFIDQELGEVQVVEVDPDDEPRWDYLVRIVGQMWGPIYLSSDLNEQGLYGNYTNLQPPPGVPPASGVL